MAQLTMDQAASSAGSGRRNLYWLSGIAAWLQLACIFAYVLIGFVLGPEPTTVAEHYAIMSQNSLAGILRDDLTTLLLIALYLGTFPGLYVALRPVSPIAAALATVFALIAVTICITTHSTLSMLYLSRQYAAAVTEAQRALLLASGEAVIASDLWNSSAGAIAGVLLQGSGVVMSAIMLRSRSFGRVTGTSGLIANGLDLTQHLIHFTLPAAAAMILWIAGPFYIVWYAMLGRDFFKLARGERQA